MRHSLGGLPVDGWQIVSGAYSTTVGFPACGYLKNKSTYQYITYGINKTFLLSSHTFCLAKTTIKNRMYVYLKNCLWWIWKICVALFAHIKMELIELFVESMHGYIFILKKLDLIICFKSSYLLEFVLIKPCGTIYANNSCTQWRMSGNYFWSTLLFNRCVNNSVNSTLI